VSLADEFARCRPWLARAVQGPKTIEDAQAAVLEGRALLWPGAKSAAVTEFNKDLHIWLAGGDLGELKRMEQSAEAHAREWGCDRMTIIGRKGWERALPGYRRVTLLVKDL
jgi:hypothetical protein